MNLRNMIEFILLFVPYSLKAINNIKKLILILKSICQKNDDRLIQSMINVLHHQNYNERSIYSFNDEKVLFMLDKL